MIECNPLELSLINNPIHGNIHHQKKQKHYWPLQSSKGKRPIQSSGVWVQLEDASHQIVPTNLLGQTPNNKGSLSKQHWCRDSQGFNVFPQLCHMSMSSIISLWNCSSRNCGRSGLHVIGRNIWKQSVILMAVKDTITLKYVISEQHQLIHKLYPGSLKSNNSWKKLNLIWISPEWIRMSSLSLENVKDLCGNIILVPSTIHPKSEKVCGVGFPVQNILQKKWVNFNNKISRQRRQRCVNYEMKLRFTRMWVY